MSRHAPEVLGRLDAGRRKSHGFVQLTGIRRTKNSSKKEKSTRGVRGRILRSDGERGYWCDRPGDKGWLCLR